MKMPSISDLIRTKMNEIQSRLPMQFNIGQPSNTDIPFVKYIEAEQEETSDTMINIFTPVAGSSATFKNIANSMSGINTNYLRYSAEQLNDIMPKIDSAVQTAAQAFNLDPKLIKAVIANESSYQPLAVSKAGAQGLMQLMPNTAKGLGVTDSFDIYQNIIGGSQYLRYQLDEFGNNLDLALAAYNAGPGSVKKYNGIPPYDETQNYVRKVKETYAIYSSK